MTWVAAGLLAKRIGSAVWTWLSHATLWQLVSIGLAVFAVVQHFELAHSRKDAAAYLKQRDEIKAQLDAISSKRTVQRQVTHDNIITITKTIHDADSRAKVIEQAPLPGNCQTPKAVLDADI